MHDSEKAEVYYEYGKMLGAGIGVGRATESLSERYSSGSVAAFAKKMRDALADGCDVAESVERAGIGERLSDMEVGVIAAAERGGQLEEGFRHLGNYYESLNQTRKTIRTKLVYPLVLVHAAVILPAIPKLFVENESFLLSIAVWLGILYAILIVAYFVFKGLIERARTSVSLDRLLNKIPIFGPARRFLALNRFCKVFHIHLLSGSKISQGVQVSALASGSAVIADRGRQMVPEIEGGNPLGPAMLAASPSVFPNDLSRAVISAEEVGALDEEMLRWSQLMRAESEAALEKVATWTPKLIYAMVVVFVGYQIVTMTMNRFENYNSILNGDF